MFRRNKKGFTLIEILIVIAIIGALAAIVLVKLSDARKKAKISAVKKIMKSLNVALTDCAASGKITGSFGGSEYLDSGTAHLCPGVLFPTIPVCGANLKYGIYSDFAVYPNHDAYFFWLYNCPNLVDCQYSGGQTAFCGIDGCTFSGTCK